MPDQTDTKPEHLTVQDARLERLVLGAMMMSETAVDRVLPILDEGAFCSLRHRKLFRVMVDMREAGQVVDVNQVVQEAHRRKMIEPHETDWVVGIRGEVGTYAGIVQNAKDLVDLRRRRDLVTASDRIRKASEDTSTPITDVLAIAERAIYGSSSDATPDIRTGAECVAETLEKIEERARHGGHLAGIPSGYAELDRITGGFRPGELILLAARPSVGKTAFALNILRHVAVNERLPVAIFSLEMNRDSITKRLVSAVSEIEGHALNTGEVYSSPEPEAFAQISRAADVLAGAPWFVLDAAALTCTQIRALSRRLIREKQARLIIVDYLGLIRPDTRAENRTQEVARISSALKALARETDTPVLVACQLNREPEAGGDPTPRLAHLRDSGTLEQDADVVLLLHRPEMYLKPGADPATVAKLKGLTDVHVAKNRNGRTGNAVLTFKPEFQRFDSPGDPDDE